MTVNPALGALEAALLGVAGFLQADRLLALTLPADVSPLVAEHAEIEEGIGPLAQHVTDRDGPPPADPSGAASGLPYVGCRIRMTALSDRCDLVAQDMIGQPLLLQLRQADGGLRPFHGVVTRFALLGSDGAKTRYELMAEPWLSVLQWRTDSRVFTDMTVIEIIDAVFTRYRGQGRFMPAWRWMLANTSVYPRRSRCHQYAESDLRFVCRLLAEEGIFFAVEHEGDPVARGLGAHTLLLYDDNAPMQSAQPGALRMGGADTTALDEDRVYAWTQASELANDSIELASFDYRNCTLRPVVASADGAGTVALPLADVPGAYAYGTSAQGERLARRRLEALRLHAEHFEGAANVRTLAPLQRFALADAYDGDAGPFVATWLRHRGRSNLGGDTSARARLERWEDELPDWVLDAPEADRRTEGAQYTLEIRAVRASTPVRPPAGALGPDARPQVRGLQTAIVVGDGRAPIHTDRDHRVRVQHHWQRGSVASQLLESETDNAPADRRSSTWVPVAELQAGVNAGTNFLPRVGQEVALGYLQGDIDRAVVLGAVHNGIGQTAKGSGIDAQGSRIARGGSGATGNAPQWFPGWTTAGEFDGHRHAAVLDGYKSQALAASAAGMGGYNQWVHDSTPGSPRTELSTTQAGTRLQLGRLRHQDDNRLLDARGHGLDLSTEACGAARAGSGLLLSAHGHPDSSGIGQQMDTAATQVGLHDGLDRDQALAGLAQRHQAMLPAEPAPATLPALAAAATLQDSLQGTAGADAGDFDARAAGGRGEYAAFGRPDLVLAAPAGIALLTPADLVASAGGTLGWSARLDLCLTAQRHHASAIAKGMVWFTQGQPPDSSAAGGPAATGIALHAANGSVHVQASRGGASWVAAREVQVTSTDDAVIVGASTAVLLNGAGSAIRIDEAGITFSTGGSATFRAGQKTLVTGASVGGATALSTATLAACAFGADEAGSTATSAI